MKELLNIRACAFAGRRAFRHKLALAKTEVQGLRATMRDARGCLTQLDEGCSVRPIHSIVPYAGGPVAPHTGADLSATLVFHP